MLIPDGCYQDAWDGQEQQEDLHQDHGLQRGCQVLNNSCADMFILLFH